MIQAIIECSETTASFTTADWINSISAISALLTAIVTLITVREIKKQREHSYHPDINIANFEFFVYRYDKDYDDEEDVFTLYYSTKQLLDSDPKKGYNELTIDINNIGLAAAKQVFWQWKVDFEEIAKSLKSGDNEFINFEILEDNISVSAKKIDVDWFYLEGDENFGDFFNFILPYSIENRKNTIRIPTSFLDLYWLYKAKEILIDNHNNKIEYPPLQLFLKYTNMHGKEIEKTFLIYLAWNFMSNPLNYQSELAKFRFEIFEAKD